MEVRGQTTRIGPPFAVQKRFAHTCELCSRGLGNKIWLMPFLGSRRLDPSSDKQAFACLRSSLQLFVYKFCRSVSGLRNFTFAYDPFFN